MNVFLSSLIAGLLTGVGALFSVAIKKPNKKLIGSALGFAAGIMLGISFFHLLLENTQKDKIMYLAIGLALGLAFMYLLEKLIPHSHGEKKEDDYLKMGYFIMLGIALHNFPEGLAIGASYGVSEKIGFTMAILIGLHNIVEGVAVSLPLAIGKMKSYKVILMTTLTGLSTLLGAAVANYLISISESLISISMAFAAGAMIYISVLELIPSSKREDFKFANIGLAIGLITSLFL